MEETIDNKPIMGKGAKVWLFLCIAINAALFVITLFLIDFDVLSGSWYIWFPISIGIIAGYIVLITGRRIGFLLLTVCAFLNIINSIFLGLFAFQTVATAVLNLGITMIAVGRSWKRMKPSGKSITTIVTSIALITLAGLTVVFGILDITGPYVRFDFDGRLELREESGTVVLQHRDFVSAKAVKNEGSGSAYNVQLTLTSEGWEKLRLASRENIGNRLNFYIGEFLLFSPIVSNEVDGESFVITFGSGDDGRAYVKCLNDNIKRYS